MRNKNFKGETDMYYLNKIALWLVIIGGISWGLVGAFNFDLVALLLGDLSILARIVYVLVGLSALWLVYSELFSSSTVIEKEK